MVKRFEIWLANLDPRFGNEAGKTRPVLVIQNDALNKVHPSTLICPLTSNVKKDSTLLRVFIPKGVAGLQEDCDVMIDQLRAIDNKRMIQRLGQIPPEIALKVQENVRIVLDL
jgi:mRNA interferase MazF